MRILSEYAEPLSRFRREKIQDTVVFFGSARFASLSDAQGALTILEKPGSAKPAKPEEQPGGDDPDTLQATLKRAHAAVEMARAHLRSGHDVVVPQLLARLEFIETLESLSAETGATFHEVLVLASSADAYARLQARRAELERSGVPHPLRLEALDAEKLDATILALRSIAAARPATRIIQTKTGDVRDAYRRLCEALAE